jgi:hypothetical protein
MERCAVVEPALREVQAGRRVACHLYDGEWSRESA